jgi:hypothetical protein
MAGCEAAAGGKATRGATEAQHRGAEQRPLKFWRPKGRAFSARNGWVALSAREFWPGPRSSHPQRLAWPTRLRVKCTVGAARFQHARRRPLRSIRLGIHQRLQRLFAAPSGLCGRLTTMTDVSEWLRKTRVDILRAGMVLDTMNARRGINPSAAAPPPPAEGKDEGQAPRQSRSRAPRSTRTFVPGVDVHHEIRSQRQETKMPRSASLDRMWREWRKRRRDAARRSRSADSGGSLRSAALAAPSRAPGAQRLAAGHHRRHSRT